jgi:hypothetical protein
MVMILQEKRFGLKCPNMTRVVEFAELSIQRVLVLLVLASLLVSVFGQNLPLAQAEKVSILSVSAPNKLYDNEPLVMTVQVQSFQAGGKVKLVLSSAIGEIGSVESSTQIDVLNRGTTLNLTLTSTPMTRSTTPYQLVLDAYWEATLGGSTKEASQKLTVQVVGIVFDVDDEPKTVDSLSKFNLTFHVTNQGNDVAESATAELSELGGFGAEGPTTVPLGDIKPSETKQVTFAFSSGWLDVLQSQRRVVLTIHFSDWRGIEHATTIPADILLRPSQTSLTYWIAIGAVVSAFLLFVLFRAKSISAFKGLFRARA